MGRPQGLGAYERDPCGVSIFIPSILSFFSQPSRPASKPGPFPWPAGQTWPIYGLAAPDNGLPAPGRARQNRARSKRRLGYSAVVTIQCTQVVGVPKYPGNIP